MSVRRSVAFTISFELVDPNNRPARLSGATFATGDCKISQDGGTFANTTNAPTEIGTTGRYTITLTALEMNGAWIHVFVQNSQVDPRDIVLGTDGSQAGTIVADAGNTALTFKTDRTEATNDYWVYALIEFTTGALAGQVKQISAYTGATKFITVDTAFTGTPSNGDRFILVNM